MSTHPDEDEQDAFGRGSWQGFTITCDRCGKPAVIRGAMGTLYLECPSCGSGETLGDSDLLNGVVAKAGDIAK